MHAARSSSSLQITMCFWWWLTKTLNDFQKKTFNIKPLPIQHLKKVVLEFKKIGSDKPHEVKTAYEVRNIKNTTKQKRRKVSSNSEEARQKLRAKYNLHSFRYTYISDYECLQISLLLLSFLDPDRDIGHQILCEERLCVREFWQISSFLMHIITGSQQHGSLG